MRGQLGRKCSKLGWTIFWLNSVPTLIVPDSDPARWRSIQERAGSETDADVTLASSFSFPRSEKNPLTPG
jgi:hypothetical protein